MSKMMHNSLGETTQEKLTQLAATILDYMIRDGWHNTEVKSSSLVAINKVDELSSKLQDWFIGFGFGDLSILKDTWAHLGNKNKLTDSNVDYTKLTKEPVYFDFIDVGEAFNKLKMFEYLSRGQSVHNDNTEYIFIPNYLSNSVEPLMVIDKTFKDGIIKNAQCVDRKGRILELDENALETTYTFNDALQKLYDSGYDPTEPELPF